MSLYIREYLLNTLTYPLVCRLSCFPGKEGRRGARREEGRAGGGRKEESCQLMDQSEQTLRLPEIGGNLDRVSILSQRENSKVRYYELGWVILGHVLMRLPSNLEHVDFIT